MFLSRVAPFFAGLAVIILLFAIYRMSGFRVIDFQIAGDDYLQTIRSVVADAR